MFDNTFDRIPASSAGTDVHNTFPEVFQLLSTGRISDINNSGAAMTLSCTSDAWQQMVEAFLHRLSTVGKTNSNLLSDTLSTLRTEFQSQVATLNFTDSGGTIELAYAGEGLTANDGVTSDQPPLSSLFQSSTGSQNLELVPQPQSNDALHQPAGSNLTPFALSRASEAPRFGLNVLGPEFPTNINILDPTPNGGLDMYLLHSYVYGNAPVGDTLSQYLTVFYQSGRNPHFLTRVQSIRVLESYLQVEHALHQLDSPQLSHAQRQATQHQLNQGLQALSNIAIQQAPFPATINPSGTLTAEQWNTQGGLQLNQLLTLHPQLQPAVNGAIQHTISGSSREGVLQLLNSYLNNPDSSHLVNLMQTALQWCNGSVFRFLSAGPRRSCYGLQSHSW